MLARLLGFFFGWLVGFFGGFGFVLGWLFGCLGVAIGGFGLEFGGFGGVVVGSGYSLFFPSLRGFSLLVGFFAGLGLLFGCLSYYFPGISFIFFYFGLCSFDCFVSSSLQVWCFSFRGLPDGFAFCCFFVLLGCWLAGV